MAFQIPMGAFVDYTTRKKTFLIVFGLVSTLAPLVILLTQNIPVLLVKSVLEGFFVTGIRAFKGPFTLGIAGHENFESIAGSTEIFEHSGALVACAIAGAIGYALYPDVLPLFYVIAVFGSLSILSVVSMKAEINDDLARNKVLIEPSSSTTSAAKAAAKSVSLELQVEPEEIQADSTCLDDSSNDVDEDVHDDKLKEIHIGSEETQSDDDSGTEMSSESTASLWTIFFEDRNMTCFSLALFFFHLGNAAVMPLLGQVLALEDGKAGIPYTASNIAVAQLSSFLGVYTMTWFEARGYRINLPIAVGFGSLIPRIGTILLVLRFSEDINPYALIATQVFDGMGAGVNGLAILRVTKTLTEGTNRFGIVSSVSHLSCAIGGAFSNLISGYLIDAFGYEAGFGVLLVPSFLCLVFVFATKVEPPNAASKPGSSSSNNNNNHKTDTTTRKEPPETDVEKFQTPPSQQDEEV